MSGRTHVSLRPYSEADFPLLERTLGDPKMMTHLGGPESSEKLRERHGKYVAMSMHSAAGCIFVITLDTENVSAGTIGYWEKDWDGQRDGRQDGASCPSFRVKASLPLPPDSSQNSLRDSGVTGTSTPFLL